MKDRTGNTTAGRAVTHTSPCPPWCQRTHGDAGHVLVHMADVGRVRRGHDAETMVFTTAVESLDTLTGTWTRKTPYVSVSGYHYGAKPYKVYNLDDLTADQARTLAGLFELAGSAELAGFLRQAAALVDEEAGS